MGGVKITEPLNLINLIKLVCRGTVCMYIHGKQKLAYMSCDRSCDLHLGDGKCGFGRHLQVHHVPRPLTATRIRGNQEDVGVLQIEAGVRVRETSTEQLLNVSVRERTR